ncbi:mycothiol transferase [Blastococcus sp. SYSU DS0619]
MPQSPEPTQPGPLRDEAELLLAWLDHLRVSILRKVADLDEEQVRWRPDGALIPLLGIVNHLTHVEWRWIDGAVGGAEVSRSEAEFAPGPELTVADAVRRYRERARATAQVVRSLPITQECADASGRDLRWVLLHLVEETARHAGHADATRELLDGVTGR